MGVLRAFALGAGGLLLAGVGSLVLVAVLFAQGNPALSQRVLDVVNDALGSDSTRIAAERVSGRLFGAAELRHPRLLVRSPDGEVTWAEAEWLRVEYDAFQLLFGNRRALRVAIEGPRVAITHDRSGNLVIPRFATRPRRGPSQALTQIDVRFADGAFTLDRGGVRFGGLRGEIETRAQGGQTTLLVKRLEGHSEMKGRPGAVRVDGRAILSGRTMRIEPLSVALDSTRAAVTVDWDLAGARVVSSTFRFAPLDLDEVMRLLDLTPVTPGTLRGEATFAGDPTQGSARVRLSGVVAGEIVDTLAATGTMVPGAIRIEDLTARFRGGRLRGSGIYETRGALKADLVLEEVDPAALPWTRGLRSVPRGSLNARVLLAARRARPMAVADAAIEILPGRVGRAVLLRGRAHVRRSSGGAFELDSAWVETPGARVEARGSIARDRMLAFHFDASIREAGAMDEILRPVEVETGSGRAEGDVSGPASAPEFRARAALRAGRLRNGLRFDSLVVEGRGRLGSALAAQLEARAAGLTAGDRAIGSATALLAYDGTTLEVRRYRQELGDTTLALRGRVTFPPRAAHAILDSVSWAVGTRVWRNEGPVDATLEGERLRVTRLRLGLESGTLDLVGDIWLREPRIAARGSLRGFDLGRAPGTADSSRGFGGRASIEFEAEGSLRDPEVTAVAEVLRPRFRALSGDSLTLRIHYQPGLLAIEEARLVGAGGRVELTGRAEPRLRLEDWIRSVAKGEKDWAGRVPLALQVSVDSLGLDRIALLSPQLETLSGSVTLRASVGGTAAAPEIRLRAKGAHLAYRGVQLESAELEGGYAGRRFSLASMSLRQGNAVSNVRGFVPVDLSLTAERRSVPDDSMRLVVRMSEADFSVARLFIAPIASSTGKLTVNADVAGTPARPQVTGTLRLADGTIRFAGRDEVLEDVELEGTLSEERITATRIAAREGRRGRIRGSGWWRWVRGTPLGEYDLRIRAEEFTATDHESYLLRFTGDFSIRNGRTPAGAPLPRITGTAVVGRGELTWIQRPTAPEERPPTPFLYEVALEIPRNLWFRNLDTEVELGGRLVAKNEGKVDILLGDLDVLRGRYYVCYSKFRISSGMISFHDVEKIDPEVTIDAETRVRGPNRDAPEEVVKMALSGHSSQLKITPYDEHNSNPSYLWKALCIGQLSSMGSEQAIAAGQDASAGGADVTLPIRDYLFRNVERWLGDVGLIDTIDLKSGEVTTRVAGAGAPAIGSVGLGKYVTPALYLRYSRDFSGTAERKISAEYRVTRHLLLKGEQVQRPAQKDRAESQYNLDLKIRFEY
jgi:hypothetical protein